MLNHPELHIWSPSSAPSIATDPFTPLSNVKTRMYLFRVVWGAVSQEEQQLSRKPTQTQMRKCSLAPLFSNQLTASQFDYHLSGACHGDLSTPFTSWYASYQQAAARAEKLRNQGYSGIQILVVWAEGLRLFDGYAVAKALGYPDENNACDDTRGWTVSVLDLSASVTDFGALARRVPADRPRLLIDHVGEYLLLGNNYVEAQHLVTHIDWRGPIDRVSDGSTSGIEIPRWMIFPELDDAHLQQQRQQQQRQQGFGSLVGEQRSRSCLDLSFLFNQNSEESDTANSRPNLVSKPSMASLSSLASSSSHLTSSSQRNLLRKQRRPSYYPIRATDFPSSSQVSLLRATKGIRDSLRTLSTIIERNNQSQHMVADDSDSDSDDGDYPTSSPYAPLQTSFPSSYSPIDPRPSSRHSRRSTLGSSSVFSPISSSPTLCSPISPLTSSLLSPRFTRNNSVLSLLLSPSSLTRPSNAYHRLSDWNEINDAISDSSDDEEIISQRLTGRATKPQRYNSGSSSSSGSSSRGSGSGSRSRSRSTAGGDSNELQASVCAPPADFFTDITPQMLRRALASRVYLRRRTYKGSRIDPLGLADRVAADLATIMGLQKQPRRVARRKDSTYEGRWAWVPGKEQVQQQQQQQQQQQEEEEVSEGPGNALENGQGEQASLGMGLGVDLLDHERAFQLSQVSQVLPLDNK